jgi:hypothetical protein
MLNGVPAKTDDELRKFIFVTLGTAGLQSLFEMDTIAEAEVRRELQSTFATRSGRAWWDTGRSWWITEYSTSKAERRFKRIVREEYDKAIANGPPVSHDIVKARPGIEANLKNSAIAGVAMGLCVGIMVGARIKAR